MSKKEQNRVPWLLVFVINRMPLPSFLCQSKFCFKWEVSPLGAVSVPPPSSPCLPWLSTLTLYLLWVFPESAHVVVPLEFCVQGASRTLYVNEQQGSMDIHVLCHYSAHMHAAFSCWSTSTRHEFKGIKASLRINKLLIKKLRILPWQQQNVKPDVRRLWVQGPG